MDSLDETRRRSAALFGNEKAVEVIVALDEEGSATAQTIAVRTGITYSLLRDARRECGGVIAGGRVRDMKGPAGRLPGGAGVHGVGGVLILMR
jgi:GTP-sensing pleiotropic transcriptional regulator CodY